MTIVKDILLLIACAYGALLLLLYFAQAKLIYFPDSSLVANPAAIGLRYDPITIRTDDGVELDSWFIPAAGAHKVLLFFHGNAGNISHRLESIKIFHDLGLAVLIFDYRGYGHSTGEPSEQGTYRDAVAVWRYLTEERGIAANNIIVFGRSLGGAIASHLASRHKPAALILESTFTSVPDMAAIHYPFLPVRWLARFSYDTRANLAAISCPLLIIHSPDDEIAPYRLGQELLAAARPPKQFLPIRGGHNDGFLLSGPTYTEGLDAFLAAHVRR